MFAFQCCENLPLVSIESFVPTLNPLRTSQRSYALRNGTHKMVMLKALAR